MPFTKHAQKIVTLLEENKGNVGKEIDSILIDLNDVDAMLSIGYATHYAEQELQDLLMSLIDKNATDRTPAQEIAHTARKASKCGMEDQLNRVIKSDFSHITKIRIAFWSVYLSDKDQQSFILRQLELFHK